MDYVRSVNVYIREISNPLGKGSVHDTKEKSTCYSDYESLRLIRGCRPFRSVTDPRVEGIRTGVDEFVDRLLWCGPNESSDPR